MAEATIPTREEAVTPRPLHELVPALIAVMERIRSRVEAEDWFVESGDTALPGDASVLADEARSTLESTDGLRDQVRDLITCWWSVGADLELSEQRTTAVRGTLRELIVHAQGHVGEPRVRRALFDGYVVLVVFFGTEDDDIGRVDWEPALSQLIQASGLLGAEVADA